MWMKDVPQRARWLRLLAPVLRPAAIVVVAAITVLGTAAGVTLHVISQDTITRCQDVFVPAFFYSGSIWEQAADSKPAPSVMILDISGLGAGDAPVAHFQEVVRLEKAAGVTILGYSSTAFGQRPAAQVESDARNYKAWYGVSGMFLDEVRGVPGQLPYYRELAAYIHRVIRGSAVWINPGTYPDQGYMSVADVVMAFEGAYAAYRGLEVPGWAYDYKPSRFAHTIYDTPPSQVRTAIDVSRSRNAGYLYVTDESGANPYRGLPSYWPGEDAAIAAGCKTALRAQTSDSRRRQAHSSA
jgi:hypothetical protein